MMRKNCSKKLFPDLFHLSSNNLGFTLIELLLVISLITLVFSLGIVQYNRFNRSQVLTKAKDELISNLRLTQSKAMTGEKPDSCLGTLSGHKLKFLDNQNYKIVAVCGEEVEVKSVVILPSGVIKQEGPNEIFFRVLSQGIESDISLTLSGFGETKTITVNTAGEIK